MANDNANTTPSLQDSLKLNVTPSKIKEGLSHVINGNVESVQKILEGMFKDGENFKKIKHDNVRRNLTRGNNAEALSLIVKAEEMAKERNDKLTASGKEAKAVGSKDEFVYYKNLLNAFYRRRTSLDTTVVFATLVDYVVTQLAEHACAVARKRESKFLDERCMFEGIEELEVYALIRNSPTFQALYHTYQECSRSTEKTAFKEFGFDEGVEKGAKPPKYPLQGQCTRIIQDVGKSDSDNPIKVRGPLKRFVVHVVAVDMLNMLYQAVNTDIVAENSKTATVKNARKVITIIAEANGGSLTQFNTYLDGKLEECAAWCKTRNQAREEKKAAK